MINMIALLLVVCFLCFLEALREIRNNQRKANASNALERALDHGFVESPLTAEEIAALHAARWDGDR